MRFCYDDKQLYKLVLVAFTGGFDVTFWWPKILEWC